jgi:hypothetical protein
VLLPIDGLVDETQITVISQTDAAQFDFILLIQWKYQLPT